MNYWTLGKYESLFSDRLLRFDENNLFDQVWMSCYLIKNGKNGLLGYMNDEWWFDDLKKFLR